MRRLLRQQQAVRMALQSCSWMTPARSSVAAMRHKLLPVSAEHVTICTRSVVGEGDLVHHCDSGVSEAC